MRVGATRRAGATRQAGMTLIELLVAMSVLSILTVLGYRAFSAVLLAREHLMAHSVQWMELARLFRRIERDLDRLPPGGVADATRLVLQPTADGARLGLSVILSQTGEGGDAIEYRSRPRGVFWSSQQAGDQSYLLLPPAYQVRWRVLLSDGRLVETWPIPAGGLPRALEMQVNHAAIGPVIRLWRLP